MVAVDICNLALSYLGDAATVTSIDPPEGSAQAQHCARFYPMAQKLLLEAHEWNFATKRTPAALVKLQPFDAWQFAYAVPADTTSIISVLPASMYPSDYFSAATGEYFGGWWPLEFELSARRDFQMEVVNGQQVILSNAEQAVLRYTSSTVQPGAFPAQFTDALAWKLAAMLAGPLIKGDVGAAESKRCLQMHQIVLEQAKGQDANQRRGNYQPVPSNIRARNA